MDADFEDLMTSVRAYNVNATQPLLLKAYRLTKTRHAGQVRRSGEPYHVHPIAVADLVIRLRLDEEAIAAALLHDVMEDTDVTKDQLAADFGQEIADLVDGVTKLDKLQFKTREERQAETLRKMIVATARDVRVLLVKLCDRVHNMRTLRHMPRDRQKAIAAETMEIYAPLANRLGVHWIKAELEDMSLKYLKPEIYQDLKKDIASKQSEREKATRQYQEALESRIRARRIRGDVLGRSKHFYSIYAKMVRQEIPFEEVFDLLGLRVIVESDEDCYNVLGIIHSLWTPAQGRFKDYIRLPKPNGYQSLHTAVTTDEDFHLEVQIRTRKMHEIAENGVAAHWAYKEGQMMRSKELERIEGLKQLLELGKESSGPREFLSAVKMDLYDDTVFVQTPKGDVRALPRGASPVDFAFSIHSEVGFHCTGAKVNGRMVPLDHELQDGDTVEIRTHQGQKPNRDWLKFLKSPRARLKVRNYVKKTQTETAARIGAGLLEKEMDRFSLSYNKVTKKGDMVKAARALDFDAIEPMLVQIGNHKLDPDEVIKLLMPEDEYLKIKHPKKKENRLSSTGVFERLNKKTQSGIVLDEMDSLSVRYARCCKPIHGDGVIGFMSRGRGMTVHVRSCRNAQHLIRTEPERVVDVNWNSEVKSRLPVTLVIDWDRDRPGILADVTRALAEEGINITQVNFCGDARAAKFDNIVEILIDDLSHLQEVIRKLKRIDNITKVSRRVV